MQIAADVKRKLPQIPTYPRLQQPPFPIEKLITYKPKEAPRPKLKYAIAGGGGMPPTDIDKIIKNKEIIEKYKIDIKKINNLFTQKDNWLHLLKKHK